MATSKFGAGGAIEQFLRQQREREDMINRIVGPSLAVSRAMKALESPIAKYALARETDTFTKLLRATDFHTKLFQELRLAAKPSWMRALQSTAIGIDRDRPGLMQIERLAASNLNQGIFKTAKLLEANQSALSGIMAATRWQTRFQDLLKQTQPSLGIMRTAIEQARMLDAVTLRASQDVVRSASAVATEQMLEVNHLVDALADAGSPDETATLFVALLTVLGRFFDTFGENTLDELRKMGAIGFLSFVVVLLTLMQMEFPKPVQTQPPPAWQQQLSTLRDQFDAAHHAAAKTDADYLSSLPRAALHRAAQIRREPNGKSTIIMRAPPETELAIKRIEGRWLLVVYRDPLSDQLAEGWVFRPAVTEFAASPGTE